MTKSKKYKYVAKLDGVIVGQHQTHVIYTHALITQFNEERDRIEAYRERDESDRPSFERDTRHAQGDFGRSRSSLNPWLMEHARKAIEGGFDAWCKRDRELAIKIFEERKREGGYNIRVQWLRPGQVDPNDTSDDSDVSPVYTIYRVVPAETSVPLSPIEIALKNIEREMESIRRLTKVNTA